MSRRKRKGTCYSYKVRNGQWFVSIQGATRKKQTEHGPYDNREAAEAFVKQHAEARDKAKFVHPGRLPVHYSGTGVPMSNNIPGNATVKVNHTHASKHGRKNTGGQNLRNRAPTKSFDQRWFEGLKRFLYEPQMEAA